MLACATATSARGGEGRLSRGAAVPPPPALAALAASAASRRGGGAAQKLRATQRCRLGPAVGPRPASPVSFSPLLSSSPVSSRAESAVRSGGSVDDASTASGWWTEDEAPGHRSVSSTAALLNELSTAGDALVVVHFFARWCGACRALHPKLNRILAERPDIRFVSVDYDSNKPMSRRLGVKVLPYFQLFRGSQGKVSEFSCTITKVQKLRDELEKHAVPRCTLGAPMPVPVVRQLQLPCARPCLALRAALRQALG